MVSQKVRKMKKKQGGLTRNMEKSKLYSKELNDIIENLVEEEGYTYKVIMSSCDISFYSGTDEEKKKAHIDHISRDYFIDEGLELVDYNCFIKDEMIMAELIMRKKTDDILYS